MRDPSSPLPGCRFTGGLSPPGCRCTGGLSPPRCRCTGGSGPPSFPLSPSLVRLFYNVSPLGCRTLPRRVVIWVNISNGVSTFENIFPSGGNLWVHLFRSTSCVRHRSVNIQYFFTFQAGYLHYSIRSNCSACEMLQKSKIFRTG